MLLWRKKWRRVGKGGKALSRKARWGPLEDRLSSTARRRRMAGWKEKKMQRTAARAARTPQKHLAAVGPWCKDLVPGV
jgi:hypothetical protein